VSACTLDSVAYNHRIWAALRRTSSFFRGLSVHKVAKIVTYIPELTRGASISRSLDDSCSSFGCTVDLRAMSIVNQRLPFVVSHLSHRKSRQYDNI